MSLFMWKDSKPTVRYCYKKKCDIMRTLLEMSKENYTRFVGEKFGELTILEFIETRKKAMIIRQFRCLCSCGKEITKRADFILYGKTKSCGHLKGENLKKTTQI